MKAVNLIPAELRRGDSSGGHSGGVVYVVLAALAVLVALTGMWAALGKVAADRKVEATRLQAEASKVEARAAELAHFQSAAAASRARVEEVRTIAATRFEWAHVLREVSRTLPKQAWVTSVIGTVGPNVTVDGGGNPLRASEQAPAVELVGCTRTQDEVAKLMAQLRAMDGVTRVALSASEKSEQVGKGDAPSNAKPSDGDCRAGSDRPQFSIVVFFQPTGQQGTTTGGTTAAGGTAAAPGTAQKAADGQAAPPAGSTAPGTAAPASTPTTSTGAAQ